MTETPPKARRPDGPASRAERLKAALKANLQKRKAQARARGDTTSKPGTEPERKG